MFEERIPNKKSKTSRTIARASKTLVYKSVSVADTLQSVPDAPESVPDAVESMPGTLDLARDKIWQLEIDSGRWGEVDSESLRSVQGFGEHDRRSIPGPETDLVNRGPRRCHEVASQGGFLHLSIPNATHCMELLTHSPKVSFVPFSSQSDLEGQICR